MNPIRITNDIVTKAETRSAISQEDLYFAPLSFVTPTDTIIIPQIPRTYLHHAFSTRRAAINFFQTHNTAYLLPERASWLLSYKATCVQMSTKNNTCTSTCNFRTTDVEKTIRHYLLQHKIIHTLGDRAFDHVQVTPFAQAATNADKRKNLRDHLFGARLATLCKMSRVPVFNKTTNLIERSYSFNDRPFTIIYSLKDDFTSKYLALLRPIEIKSQFLDVAFKVPETFIPQLSAILGEVKASFFSKMLAGVSTFVGVTSNLAILLSNPSTFIATAAVTSLVAHLSASVGPMIINFLSGVRAQSAFSWVPVAISFTLMLVLGGKTLASATGLSIFKHAHTLGYTLGSIGIFHRIFSEAWRELYPFIHQAIYGNLPTFDECLSQLKEFQDLVNQVEDFEKSEFPAVIMTSRAACDEIIVMNKRLDRLYVEADRAKIRLQFTQAVKTIHEKVRGWQNEAKKSAHSACGIRVEPVVLHMFGESGIGKSMLTALFATEIMKDRIGFVTGDNIHNHMYTRNANSEFWAGYRGQAVVVFDDYMQKMDSESSPNPEVFDLIQSANNSPFLVPMAELSEKANSYFISKLIILTSNVKEFKPKSITHPDALRRRVDTMVQVTRSEPKPTKPGEIDTSCYKFGLCENGKVIKEGLTFEQIITILREKIAIKESGCGDLSAALIARQKSEVINVPLDMNDVVIRNAIQRPAYTVNSAVPARDRKGIVVTATSQGLFDFMSAKAKYTDYTHLKEMDVTTVLKRLREVTFTPDECICPELSELFLQENRDLVRLIRPALDTEEDIAAFDKMIIHIYFDDDKLQETLELLHANLSDARIKEILAYLEGPQKVYTRMVELTYFGYLKALYFKTSFADIVIDLAKYMTASFSKHRHSFVSAGLLGLSVISVFAVYSMMNRIREPEQNDTLATPQEYAAAYHHIINSGNPGATEVLSDDCYEELYNMKAPWAQDPARFKTLQKATTAIRESWDIEGKTPRMRGPVKGSKTFTMARKQAAIDEACELVAEKVKNNMATIHGSEFGAAAGSAVFVQGRVCFLNAHTLEGVRLADPDTLWITLPNSAEIKGFPFKDLNIKFHPEMDLCAIGFDNQVRDHSTILKNFCYERDLTYERTSARMILKRGKSFETIYTQAIVKYEALRVLTKGELSEDGLPASDDCEYFDVKNYFYYTGTETKAGDCGSLLLHVNKRITPKIMGMHVAGNPNIGYSFVLVREHIELLLDQFPKHQTLIFNPPAVAISQNYDQNPVGGMTEFFGTVPALYEPTSTCIRNSELHGLFEITKGAAILRPVNGFDPLLEGAKKYGREPCYITQDEFKPCLDSVEAAIFVGTSPIEARVLTTEEAVFGIPDVVENLKTDTSPGYPWVTQKTQLPGKKHWIDNEVQTIHPDLTAAIAKLEQDSAEGIINPCIFRDTLKDERRPLKRINPKDPANIKTRLVSAAPMELTIVMKKYFGAFVAFIEKNKILNTIAIGVNPYGPDWQVIANHLHEVSSCVNDGDFSEFDVSQLPAFVDLFFRAAIRWYHLSNTDLSTADQAKLDKDQLVRHVISRHVVFSTHICRGHIYRASGKLPSGSWATTPINSCTNLGAFQYSYDKIFPNAPGAAEFHKNVRFISQGDDNIFSVRHHKAAFTCQNIGQKLKKIGMAYTAAAKGDGFLEARPIEECTFLKRGFVRMLGAYKAPLCLQTCEDMVMFTKKSNDNVAATLTNCEVALEELSISDPDGGRADKIRAALMKLGLTCAFPSTYATLRSHQDKFY